MMEYFRNERGRSWFPKQILLGLALAFWAWMLLDLFAHPVAPGPNAGGNLFRWLSALAGTGTVLTALYIMRRVPGNSISLLLLLWGAGASGWSLRSEWANPQLGVLVQSIFALVFFSVSSPALVLMLFYFPDGKPYPPSLGRWRPFLFGALSFTGMFYMFSLSPDRSVGNLKNPFYIPALDPAGFYIYLAGFIILMTAGLVVLVRRYQSGSERLRLQLRWLVWLLGIGILLAMIPFSQFSTALQVFAFLFWQSFPALAIGIAILRHNLWGIDVIIRRTLVYSALTLLLGLVYFGGVTILQSVFTAISNNLNFAQAQSPLSIVLSTLAIAALFSPLRSRVQEFVDRRFYRRKYNAEQALASFAALAREGVDLEEISDRLLGVVEETVQPESVSLWLKPTTGGSRK